MRIGQRKGAEFSRQVGGTGASVGWRAEGGTLYTALAVKTRGIEPEEDYDDVMTFRERIENDPLRFLLVALFVGFMAGIATYRGILQIAQLETVPKHKLSDRSEETTTIAPIIGVAPTRVVKKLPAVALTIRPGIAPSKAEETAASVRTDFRLRPITTLESGKTVSQIPVGTYSFVAGGRISFDWEGKVFELPNAPVRRAGSPRRYFEILKPANSPVYVMGYVAASEGANIASLDGESEHTLTMFPQPTADTTTLVILPIERIMKASERQVDLDSGDYMFVVDLVVK